MSLSDGGEGTERYMAVGCGSVSLLTVRSIKLSALSFISFRIPAIGDGGEWKLAFADLQAVCCLES